MVADVFTTSTSPGDSTRREVGELVVADLPGISVADQHPYLVSTQATRLRGLVRLESGGQFEGRGSSDTAVISRSTGRSR